MRRTGRYLIAGLLTALAVAAMAWSAARPGQGPGARLALWSGQAVSAVADTIRPDPADGQPDWAAAALAVHDGDPARGARLMVDYGCGACHDIPGVTGATGTVGPPLGGFARRAYVAGVLPNTPGGVVRWLIDPPVHAPATAMPDLGVTEADARHMAAYLFSLQEGPG